MKISGKVVTGLGKGAYYVQKYQSYLKKVLGFKCYLGTLNLETESLLPKEFKKTTILPPEKELGAVDVYKIKIEQKYKGAIVVPHKTRHPENIIEVVAPVYLREKLNLQDGDEIECELE